MAKDKVKNLFARFSVWSWKHSLLCFCIWLESFLKAHFAAAWRFLMIFLRRFSWSHSWQHFQYFPSFIEFFSIFWLILNHSIIFYVHLITFVSLETLRTLNNTRNWMQRKKNYSEKFSIRFRDSARDMKQHSLALYGRWNSFKISHFPILV